MKTLFLISLTLTSTFLFFSTFSFSQEASTADLETYIVFLEKPEEGLLSLSTLHDWYTTFLPEATSSLDSNQQRIVHSYRNVITGFAAKLTPHEVKSMEQKEGFISARVERFLSLQTTHTPTFLGLQGFQRAWNSSNYGEGVIIGMIDSGINYGHPSFFDKDMPPPPPKWRGMCAFNGKRTCNNKLIGARNFVSNARGTDLPWEDDFHGSHTSGEAAGSPVEGANVFGQANGTASGIAPKAHLAMYKACGPGYCSEADIMAAIDAAIDDGVDVISISIGPPSPVQFYNDGTALGAFRAIQKGIFVSCSAGNEGPWPFSVTNDAPWILTVGASTIDREIRATVKLGNNVELHGQTLFQPKDFHPGRPLPIIHPAATDNNESATFCSKGSLKNIDVKGKIVICHQRDRHFEVMGQEVKDNGGAAMIFFNDYQFDGYFTTPMAHVLPASQLSYKDGLILKDYLMSTPSPTATILFQGTLIGKSQTAPRVAKFSSRGPSLQSPGILKPDIIGPGVNILAAWGESIDNATVPFNVESGTSMSCPHLSGVAALIKSAHPNWSPAAIKSAILTTAYTLDLNGNPISTDMNVSATVFDMGSGHVNPSRALNPGLVYEIEPDDYIPYLCGLGYNEKKLRMIVQRKVICSSGFSIPQSQLNYPTFSILLGAGDQKTYTRTVTNVGQPYSTYLSEVRSPEGVAVEVRPSVMRFEDVNDKMSYFVTFTRLAENVTRSSSLAQGSLIWYSGENNGGGHKVVSTIAVTFV